MGHFDGRGVGTAVCKEEGTKFKESLLYSKLFKLSTLQLRHSSENHNDHNKYCQCRLVPVLSFDLCSV